jgi:hypothetical protein
VGVLAWWGARVGLGVGCDGQDDLPMLHSKESRDALRAGHYTKQQQYKGKQSRRRAVNAAHKFT